MPDTLAYAGRTVDVLLYEGYGPGESTPALAAGGWELCTGVQKAAQEFLLVLLRPKGSSPWEPGGGTVFVSDALSGRWRNVADVRQSFLAAAADALRQLRARYKASDPPDERLAAVDLVGVPTVAAGSVTVNLRATTEAGDARVFVAPVPIPIRG